MYKFVPNTHHTIDPADPVQKAAYDTAQVLLTIDSRGELAMQLQEIKDILGKKWGMSTTVANPRSSFALLQLARRKIGHVLNNVPRTTNGDWNEIDVIFHTALSSQDLKIKNIVHYGKYLGLAEELRKEYPEMPFTDIEFYEATRSKLNSFENGWNTRNLRLKWKDASFRSNVLLAIVEKQNKGRAH